MEKPKTVEYSGSNIDLWDRIKVPLSLSIVVAGTFLFVWLMKLAE